MGKAVQPRAENLNTSALEGGTLFFEFGGLMLSLQTDMVPFRIAVRREQAAFVGEQFPRFWADCDFLALPKLTDPQAHMPGILNH